MCFATPSTRAFSGPSSIGTAANLDFVLKVMPPHTATTKEIFLDVVEHERHLPGITHVGEFAKIQYLRHARGARFRRRRIRRSRGQSERGNYLEPRILRQHDRHLAEGRHASRSDDADSAETAQEARNRPGATTMAVETVHSTAASAVVMNSWTPGIPVTTLAAVELPNGAGTSGEFIKLLNAAYAAEAPVSVL
jgi:hypothetical protein